MNFQQTEQILTDLPNTFRRYGSLFNAIILGFAIACARNNIAIDSIYQNIYTNNARWGWLDVFGQLYGILRNQYETDPQYRVRLIGTLTAPHGTPFAISQFLNLALGLNTNITENFVSPSFSINFSSPVTTSTLQNVVNSINWVRPAGIPFQPLYTQTGGLFLETINYLGITKVTGSYLSAPHTTVNVAVSPSTPNPVCILPTTYFTDPFITGVNSTPTAVTSPIITS